ncbi:MAG: hypothetical protein ABSF72_06955 [Candidatus Sulfotelmatobacter sp.]
MNRKLYGISLAAVFLAISFLTSCSSSSSSHTTPPPPSTTPFAFYLSGQDTLPADSGNINYYALAGAVTIDSSGNVTAGEQDYNEGFTASGGISSPEPSGDSIGSGTLTVDATGQGTLTLVTNNSALGVSGTETLGVQFVNADHAIITQFDGSATSSGSLDLQTSLSSAPTGSFAFTINGVDPGYFPFAIGGVFTLPSATTDEFDINDSGASPPVSTANPLAISLGTPDAFGRGSITATTGLTGVSLNYYVVGPEVARIIDVDSTDAGVGSAFGQGSSTGAFANTSLTNSVFGISGNPWAGIGYGTAGQITPNATAGTFTGVAESSELETFISGAASVVGGPYSIAANGYGSMTIGGFGGGDVSALQIYATDPTLDLMDPNNASGNLDVGGALILDADAALGGGTGVIVAQTDTVATDFNGNYTAGWQDLNDLESGCPACEFDMIANGAMASGGALTLTEAQFSDPFGTLDAGATTVTGASLTGTPVPDATNAGRFTMLGTPTDTTPSLIATVGTATIPFDVVVYQASGTELFWLEFDQDSVFLGSLEAQGSLTGVPAVKRAAKVQAKH